jgi:hypothetical protein
LDPAAAVAGDWDWQAVLTEVREQVQLLTVGSRPMAKEHSGMLWNALWQEVCTCITGMALSMTSGQIQMVLSMSE